MPVREQLGFVTCLSGVLVVIDTGYLGIWSHDRPPALPDGSLETQDATHRANTFVDLRLVGADAERAGRMLGMSWHPLFVYDQPPDHPELEKKLTELARTNKLDVRFERISPRISHRQRVNQALQQGRGAGEVQFHGVWASAVSDVPTSVPLPVFGQRLPGELSDRWERVWIACRPRQQINRTENVGLVGVDYAHLLVADVDTLGAWQHEESLDGLADYVFWGRDAEVAAHDLDAPCIKSDEFGWINLPQDLALARGLAVEDYRQKRGLKFGTDYRPHSHHWRVMGPTRNSHTESGMTEVNGATVCNFMTTWGDGAFGVYRDLDSAGALVQIRIEFDQIEKVSS